jgi:hypothetical protein
MTPQRTTNPLKEALDERGDGSRAALARHVEVSPVTVARWVNKGVRPHRHFRKRIADFLDRKESELWP